MGTRIAFEFTSENNFGRIIRPAPEDGGGGGGGGLKKHTQQHFVTDGEVHAHKNTNEKKTHTK
jgi:hypothetical protein